MCGARLATALPIGDMVHAMNRMNQQQMAWRSDAQQYGAHYGSFNPDARLNRRRRLSHRSRPVPAGRPLRPDEEQRQGRHLWRRARVQRAAQRPAEYRGDSACQVAAGGRRRLPRPSRAGEQRDEESHRSNRSNISEHATGNVPDQLYTGGENIHAAGGRIGRDRDFFNDAPRPKTAAERAARVLAAHQQVADQHQQAQQERQMHALRKQAGLNDFKNGRDGRDGSAAAGAKSKTLAMQERNVAAQQQVMNDAWQVQAQRAEAQKRQEYEELQQQRMAAMRQQQQQEAIRRQQAQRAAAMERQSAMAAQHEQRAMMTMANEDVAMKSQWARNQAMNRNSGSRDFRFG